MEARTSSSPSRSADSGGSRLTNVGELERGISAFAGAVMLGTGLCRTRLTGLAIALFGAALTYRALSGHCHLYEALGLNTAGKDAGEHEDGEREPRSDQSQPMTAA